MGGSMTCTTSSCSRYTAEKLFSANCLLFFLSFCAGQCSSLYGAAAQAQAFSQQAAQALGRALASATLEAASQTLHTTQAQAPQQAQQAQSANQNDPWYKRVRKAVHQHPNVTHFVFLGLVGGLAAVLIPGGGLVLIGAKIIGGGCTGEVARNVVSYLSSDDENIQEHQQAQATQVALQEHLVDNATQNHLPLPETTFRTIDRMTFDMRTMNSDVQQLREEMGTVRRDVSGMHQELTDARQDINAMQQQITTVATSQQRLDQEQARFRRFMRALIAEQQRRTSRLPSDNNFLTSGGPTVEFVEDEGAIVPQLPTHERARGAQESQQTDIEVYAS